MYYVVDSKNLEAVGLVFADLLFAGRAGVLDIIEGIDATWNAGTTPETESMHVHIYLDE